MAQNGAPQRPGWLQHTLRNAPWRRQSQVTAIATLALLVAIIIGALYLAQATTTATTGRQLEELASVRDRLARENEQLRAEIAVLRSVPRLIERAQQLGFVVADRDQIEYLLVEGYVPDRPASVAPLQPDEVALPEYDETFAGWLQQQWDALVQQFETWTGSQPAANEEQAAP